ncbi:DUF2812 domain-containing protein [Cohnella sp. GCM10027633]|uniref:DUF2812 domain-containing protein n=1 Tax=unclassified Cohnella TaxID=2636738 RepID=UPI003625F540
MMTITMNASNPVVYRKRLSLVWNYRTDEKWLSDLSAQGLHLTKPGVFRYRFEQDSSVRYEYRLDYQTIHDAKELETYVAFFEDSGWTLAGSIMGWHYYRRPYSEGNSAEIYTDRSSLKQLYRRVQFTLAVVAILNLFLLIVNSFNAFRNDDEPVIRNVFIVLMSIQLLASLLLAYGCVKFQKKIKQIDVPET